MKIFNEVISTQDNMPYFLFSPPGVLGKYTRHILFSKLYGVFPLLQGFSHTKLRKRQYQLYVVSFSPYFSTGFKGVLTTYFEGDFNQGGRL
jgi:hypothetical protein